MEGSNINYHKFEIVTLVKSLDLCAISSMKRMTIKSNYNSTTYISKNNSYMSNKRTALSIKYYQILLKMIKPLFQHLLISGKTILFVCLFGQGKNSTGVRKLKKKKKPQTYHLEGYRKNYRSWVSSILCINSSTQSINKEYHYILGNQGSRSSFTTAKLCFRSSAYFTLAKFKRMYIIFICSKNIYLSIKRSHT